MRRGRSGFLGLALLCAGTVLLRAAPPDAARWYQAVNLAGDCLVESHDPLFNDNVLGVVDRFARQLVPPAAPGGGVPAPAGRLLLRLENQDPAILPRAPFLFLRNAGATSAGPDFQVTAFVGPRNPPEGWLREVVAALLYRRAAAQGAPFPRSPGDLPPMPLWLAEGAFQALLDTPSGVNRQIVARARFLGKTPSVEAVLGWQDLSADPLLRPWQEAFCWELYLFYTGDPARSAELAGWFRSLGGPRPAAWTLNPAVEEQWQAFQKTIGEGGEVLFSWDRTATEFAALQTFALPKVGDNPARIVKWADLPLVQNHPAFRSALEEKISRLVLLEMQAHFSWRPVIGLYRDALSSFRTPKEAASFPARLALAENAAQRLNGLSQRVGDYLNWFEVTHSAGGGAGSDFDGYFNLSGQFEAWQEAGRMDSPAPTASP